MRKFVHIVFFLIVAIGCTSRRTEVAKPIIGVSIPPVKYFIDRIGGGFAHVRILVPPGSGPETYEPTPQDMMDIGKSEIFFKTGHYDIENTLVGKIKETNPNMAISDLSVGMDMIQENHEGEDIHAGHIGGIDPHIWSGVSTAKILAGNILQEMQIRYPDRKQIFEQNYASLILEIDSLDRYIKGGLKGIKRNTFVMYHPSLGYFARDYGLEQMALEAQGKTPSAASMKLLIDQIRKEGIHTIFMQAQFDVHTTDAIAKEIKGKIITIDPLREDWLKNMYEIADQLITSLHE